MHVVIDRQKNHGIHFCVLAKALRMSGGYHIHSGLVNNSSTIVFFILDGHYSCIYISYVNLMLWHSLFQFESTLGKCQQQLLDEACITLSLCFHYV
jgi:hypothetical protein